MQEILQELKDKNITKMDAVIFYHMYNTKKMFTAEQIKFSFGFERKRVYESLKRLSENNLLEKTDEHPARYYVKDE